MIPSWPFHAGTRLDTYATDIVPDVAFFTEGLYLFITPHVIELQGVVNDGTGWTNGNTIPTVTTVPLNGLIRF
jgi:hypothetical protein